MRQTSKHHAAAAQAAPEVLASPAAKPRRRAKPSARPKAPRSPATAPNAPVAQAPIAQVPIAAPQPLILDEHELECIGLDRDIWVQLPPKTEFTVMLQIVSIERAKPDPVPDDLPESDW